MPSQASALGTLEEFLHVGRQGRSLAEASSRTLALGSIPWFPRAADGFPSLWENNRQKPLKGGEACFGSASDHDGQEGMVESMVMRGVA